MTRGLDAALEFFFGSVLSHSQRSVLRTAGDRAKVRLGRYGRYAGSPVAVLGGEERTPRFCLRVGPELAVGLDGIPAVGEASVADHSPQVFLFWLRDLADIRHDSAVEIERVLSNLDFYGSPEGGQQASSWARAIASLPDRSVLTRNLFEWLEVPSNLAGLAESVPSLRETLHHFFTFSEEGEYYARWSGSGRSVPADLSETYRQRNLVEARLRRYEPYIYSLLPARFLDPSAPAGSGMREVVWGFRFGEDGAPIGVRVLHTVPKDFEGAGDFYDFVGFEAEEGEGVALAEAARSSVDAGLTGFLQELSEEPEVRLAALQRSDLTTGGDEPRVRMFARVTAGFEAPEGVGGVGDGTTRALRVPVDRLAEVAARDDVEFLEAPKRMFPRLVDVRPMVNLPALEARIPADRRGGAGAVVGVVDGGFDAQHPAFAGRVLGVWDQSDTTGPTPADGFNVDDGPFFDVLNERDFGYGTEFTGATVSQARDGGSHGTYVAGVAAGAAVGGADPVPAGMAPRANIVAVAAGRPRPQPNNPFADANLRVYDLDIFNGVQYIREKARRHREGTPVVVNISLGFSDHAHDGTAPLSRALADLSAVDGREREGFAIVASGGNERKDDGHIQRRVAPAARQDFDFDFSGVAGNSSDYEVVTLWMTNPDSRRHLAMEVTTRQPASPAAGTPTYTQRVDHTPHWVTFWGQGIHVGTSFGPRDPVNGDFNVRIHFQSALALVPDPAGSILFRSARHRRVLVDRDWTIRGTTTPAWQQGFVVPLGDSTVQAGAKQGLSAADVAVLNGLTVAHWRVGLHNRSSRAIECHAWAGLENARFRGVSAGDRQHQVSAPADSSGVIGVASCNSKLLVPNAPAAHRLADTNPEGAISSFSSPGPLRKQPANSGIEITAPGCSVIAARSRQHAVEEAQAGRRHANTVNALAMRGRGTSVASPVVAGLIANVMAEEPNLTLSQIRARLAQCSVPTTLRDGVTPMPSNLPTSADDWGAGLIDADKLKP
ncbi:MAG: S8 family serine peptidase [Acidobacteriota bacterium]